MLEKKDKKIVTVSVYLDELNSTLQAEKAKIVGEVTNLQMYDGRSYLYFSIKDSNDQSTIKCFMWKNDYKISGVPLRDGLEIVVCAYPSIYKPNGGLSLQVEQVELVGEGALQVAYEELKKKLDSEGMFDITRKRALPEYPHRIGVITSKNGAVINDFLTNIGKFGYDIMFVDSKVEGQDATKDLLCAIKTFRQKNIDVLVIMRGGGSLESFLAFNNEVLVREVANFPVPVLTGIGHDKDVSLVSLVSDLNVSTPTAVAHMLNSSWSHALHAVNLSEQKIISTYESRIKNIQYTIENSYVLIEKKFTHVLHTFSDAKNILSITVQRIDSRLAGLRDGLVISTQNILRCEERIIERIQERINQSEKTFNLVNPLRQLSQGYSIISHAGKVVRSTKNIRSGDEIEILVEDGTIQSKVI